MKSNAYSALMLSLVLVLSSLAGCLSADEEEQENEILGKVMVSTYHVGELVSAVAGNTLDVEIISPSNVPVHDYEPSAGDLIRLQESDLFFYHGLGLEPWVEPTLATLGNDAPVSAMTHTMPVGELTLDYESLLISNLCEVLTEGPFESTTLGTMSDDHDDHDEHDHEGEHNETDDHSDEEGEDDDHDDDGEEITPETALEYFDTNSDGSLSWDEFWVSWEEGEDDDHNETDDEDHGDHDDEHEEEMSVLMEIFNESDTNMDGLLDINELEHFIHEIMELEEGHHEGHEHAEAEETIQNPAGCPADIVISIFHMEEGEYVLEFESEHDEDFDMAALMMPGGHAHHHGHDDHGDEEDDHDDHDDEMCHNTETHENYESTEEECEAAGHVWMEEGHDDHHGVCHDATTHENHDEYETEEDCEAAGHMWMEEEDHNLPEIHADLVAHTLSFPEEHDDHDDHSDEEDGHDDHSDEEGHHEVGYVVIHIEEEGEYGFALPMDVEFYVLMNDDHDHGHDDHDDHSDDEDDHDDHSDEEIEFDPHSWLDPLAFKAQVDVVKDVLTANFPDYEATFVENAEAFKAELDLLHIGFQSAFAEGANCAGNTVVANHNAYSYLSQRYDIQFTTVHGVDPEGEPTAEDIAEVIEQIEEDSLTVLFVEEYTDQSSVAGIVEQTISDTMPNGISIETLYTMELPPKDSEDSYLTVMNKNLENLKSGMGC